MVYSTVKECHVAINYKIQQIDSDRQESILPQYIDMALTEATRTIVNSKIKNYEKTGKLYDDLQVLKVVHRQPVVIDVEYPYRGFIDLPSNYLYRVKSESTVLFDKFSRLHSTTQKTLHIVKINLSAIRDRIKESDLVLSVDGQIFDFSDAMLQTKTKAGFFWLLSRMLNTFVATGLKTTNGSTIHCYLNNYRGFHKDTLIFVSNESFTVTCTEARSEEDSINYKTNIAKTIIYHGREDTIPGSTPALEGDGNSIPILNATPFKIVGNDLVSDIDVNDMLETYHNAKNRHLHPVTSVGDDKLYVYWNDQFVVGDLLLTYIKIPTQFSINDNLMAEIPVTDEIINMAVQKLYAILKDEGYQISINENKQ